MVSADHTPAPPRALHRFPTPFDDCSYSRAHRNMRRAAAVFPCVTCNTPWCPAVQPMHPATRPGVLFGPHTRVDQDDSNVRHEFASCSEVLGLSSRVTTRSRWCAPRSDLIFGALGAMPHSTANRNARRSTCNGYFTELGFHPFVCRWAA